MMASECNFNKENNLSMVLLVKINSYALNFVFVFHNSATGYMVFIFCKFDNKASYLIQNSKNR